MITLQRKNNFIQVRVQESEKNLILARAKKMEMSLSDYMRYICLNYTVRKTKTQNQYFLLLARIASNINQIARQVNTHKANINKLRLLLSLMHIEEELTSIRKCI